MNKELKESKIETKKIEREPVEHLTICPYQRFDYDKFSCHLQLPSAVHGYSLAVDYMKEFFLSTFKKRDFFKTIYINGKHVMDDYMRKSKTDKLKIQLPALAITPMPNREYNRDYLDTYWGMLDSHLANFNFETSFFKDPINNIFLSFNLKEIEMNTRFTIRVESRAMEEDIYEYMKLAFRIGATHKNFISCEFHIPYDLMLNIAHVAGFKIDKDGRILDIYDFVSYVNAHSEFPVIYKLRSVNGRYEFFIRVNGVYVWVDTRNSLSASDGEMFGKLNKNFDIELDTTMRMWTPHFYIYKSRTKIIADIPTTQTDGHIGLFSLVYFEFPEYNENGWIKEIETTYSEDELLDNGESKIPIGDLVFSNATLNSVINHCINNNLSPLIFMEIKCINIDTIIPYEINHKTLEIKVKHSDLKSTDINIAIYLDREFINSRMEVITKELE